MPFIEIAPEAMKLRPSPLLEARPVSTRMSRSWAPLAAVGKLWAKRSSSSALRSEIWPSPKRIPVIFSAELAASAP